MKGFRQRDRLRDQTTELAEKSELSSDSIKFPQDKLEPESQRSDL